MAGFHGGGRVTGTLLLLMELVALFLGVSFLVHLAQRRMGAGRMQRWMGGSPPVAALKGIAAGFVTPFCTYSAIPMLVGLRQAGVPPAGYVAFIVAAPVLDPVLFGALLIVVGGPAAALYASVAFAAAMALALAAQALNVGSQLKRLPGSEGSGIADCAPEAPGWKGFKGEARPAAMQSFDLLKTVGPLLVVGVAIGLVIEATVSPDAVARAAGGSETLAIPVAAALGTPLYIHTALFVPIANSLESAGVGVGAIVALTIAGAGANIPEFVILVRLARAWVVGVLVAYVFVVAMTGGLLAQLIAG